MTTIYSWARSHLPARGSQRWFTGVASGVAQRLGIDPLIVRLVLVLVVIFTGSFVSDLTVTAYLLAALLMPSPTGTIALQDALRGRGFWPVTGLLLLALSVLSFGADHHYVPLLLIPLAVIALLVYARRTGREPREVARSLWSRVSNPSGPGQDPATSTTGMPGATPSATPEPGSTYPSPGYPGQPSPDQPYQPYPSFPSVTTPAAPPSGASTSATTSYGSPHTGPYGMGPGRTGAVVPSAPTSVAPRRRRAGIVGLVLTVGVALVGYAVGAAVDTAHPLTGGLAGALLGTGLVLLALGLAGRRAGLPALIGLLLAGSLVLGTTDTVTTISSQGVGDRSWAPTVATLQSSYSVGAGNATLDMRGLTPADIAHQSVRVNASLGNVTVLVPSDLPVTVDAHASMGEVTLPTGTASSRGMDDSERWSTSAASGASSVLTITVSQSMGDITVQEVTR